MKTTLDVARKIWAPNLIRLRQERSEYNYRSALEISGRIRVGHSADDMLEELVSVLDSLELEGLIQRIKRPASTTKFFGINFENRSFYFTDKFDQEVTAAATRQAKQAGRQRIVEKWVRPALIGLVSGVVGGVAVWIIIEFYLT